MEKGLLLLVVVVVDILSLCRYLASFCSIVFLILTSLASDLCFDLVTILEIVDVLELCRIFGCVGLFIGELF